MLGWSRSTSEKQKRCASNRMQNARRCSNGTSRNNRNWNRGEPISSSVTNSNAANKGNKTNCSKSTLSRRKNCRSTSKEKCRGSNLIQNHLRTAGPPSINDKDKPRRPDRKGPAFVLSRCKPIRLLKQKSACCIRLTKGAQGEHRGKQTGWKSSGNHRWK